MRSLPNHALSSDYDKEASMPIPAPFVSQAMDIEKDWIDYNGHLNMAYYNVLFDRCSEAALDALGMGANYASERHLIDPQSIFLHQGTSSAGMTRIRFSGSAGSPASQPFDVGLPGASHGN